MQTNPSKERRANSVTPIEHGMSSFLSYDATFEDLADRLSHLVQHQGRPITVDVKLGSSRLESTLDEGGEGP
jgi:hypothetical protein